MHGRVLAMDATRVTARAGAKPGGGGGPHRAGVPPPRASQVAADTRPAADGQEGGRRKKKKKRKHDDEAAPPKPAAAATAAASSAGEMDDIFGGLSSAKRDARARAEVAAAAAEAAAREKAAARDAGARASARQLVRDPIFGEEYDPARQLDPMRARVYRFDRKSGLNVYKAHDLGLGHGGGTPLCPFDCQCCF